MTGWTCTNPACGKADIPLKLVRCICGAARPRVSGRIIGNVRCACGKAAVHRRGVLTLCPDCNARMDREEYADSPAEVALREDAKRRGLVRGVNESAEDFRRRCFDTQRQLLGRRATAA